jgi:hypothetical protein
MPHTKDQLAEDFRIMIKADTEHLADALKGGNRVLAHGFVDAIIDTCRELEDLEAGRVLPTGQCSCKPHPIFGHQDGCRYEGMGAPAGSAHGALDSREA